MTTDLFVSDADLVSSGAMRPAITDRDDGAARGE
jgi:hypothetical protein